jgi:hypothetical protein
MLGTELEGDARKIHIQSWSHGAGRNLVGKVGTRVTG